MGKGCLTKHPQKLVVWICLESQIYMKSTGEKHILSIGSLIVALGGKGLQSLF